MTNDSICDCLGIAYVVVGLPPDLREWVIAAALIGQRRRKLEHALTNLVAETRCKVPILSFEVINHDALAPLAESGDNRTHTLTRTAGCEQENGLCSGMDQIAEFLGLGITPAANVNAVRGI